MGIVSGLMPMLGNPAYRKLFNKTISYFPRSILILSAAIAFSNACCNVFLSTQKSQMKLSEKDNEEEVFMEGKPNYNINSSRSSL